MRDVPQHIIDILDTVRFQTFDIGGIIGGGITWMWSGVIWGIQKVPKLIWRRYTYGTAIAVYSMNHHVFHMTCKPRAEFWNTFPHIFITTNHLNHQEAGYFASGASDASHASGSSVLQ